MPPHSPKIDHLPSDASAIFGERYLAGTFSVVTQWRVLRIICQKSHNLVRLSDEYILCCDLDYEHFDLDPERVIKYNTKGPFYRHGLS